MFLDVVFFVFVICCFGSDFNFVGGIADSGHRGLQFATRLIVPCAVPLSTGEYAKQACWGWAYMCMCRLWSSWILYGVLNKFNVSSAQVECLC